MPALELFWGNPNGQFFLFSGGAARRDFNRYRLARHHYFFVRNRIEGTGASSGIGKAAALAFARDGANLVLADTQDFGLYQRELGSGD